MYTIELILKFDKNNFDNGFYKYTYKGKEYKSPFQRVTFFTDYFKDIIDSIKVEEYINIKIEGSESK